MAGIGRTFGSFVVVLVVAALLGACGKESTGAGSNAQLASGGNVAQASQLFSNDFEGVCSGASVSTAAAYDARGGTHKALYFAPYKDGFSDHSSSLPHDWTVAWSANGDALRAIDLVVCARRTAARQVKICSDFQSGGRSTHNQVRWHTATYELSVRAARTGKELAKTTVEATDTDCPMFETFSGDADTIDDYATPSETAVADFLRPHITR